MAVKKTILSLSIIAFLLTIMGILGQMFQTTIVKTKEIGIRKINGARTIDIIRMLNIKIVYIVGIAFVIATPVSYYIAQKWLTNFAYKTSVSWWIFVIAGFVAFIIAIVTTSLQSINIAQKNPINALRYE